MSAHTVKTRLFVPVFMCLLAHTTLFAQAPNNDEPCDAIALQFNTNCTNPLQTNNLGATHSPPNGYAAAGCATASAPKDVWFSLKTTNNGTSTDTKLSIKTTGTAIGQLRLFSAVTCGGAFSEITQICNASSNNLQLQATNLAPNTTYYISAAGYWDNSPLDNFTICASPPSLSGCTNPLASNYSANATIDDGSCVFNTSPASTCGVYSSQPNAFVSNSQIVTDAINVAVGQNRVITDLDVMIKLNHTFISDLQVTLTSPSGTTIDLFKNICGSSDDMEVRFDDASYALICANPIKGFYRLPIGALAIFNNEPIDGDWTLKVIDNTLDDNGSLVEWCLIPQTRFVNCLVPINGRAVSVTPTTATLTWTPKNTPTETSWNIEYGARGFTPTGVPSITNIATNPFVISGLQPKKTYDFYIQSNCGTGIKSGWAGPFTFTTALSNGECNLAINIPDNTCTSSNNYIIDVTNVNGTNLGTNVRLQEVRMIVRHSWLSDLSFYLTSPSGKTVELSSKNGGQNDNYGNPNSANCAEYTAFVQENDCSAIPIVAGQAPFIGKYYPEANLATFHDGSNPNGNWILRTCDEAGGDFGRLEYVELIFSANTCLPPGNVTATNIKDKTLDINWLSGNTSCSNIIIEYGPRGFTPGTNATAGAGGNVISLPCATNTSTYSLNNLLPTGEYDIYLREQCGATAFSENSCVVRIQTLCNQATPTLVENFDAQTNCSTICDAPCAINGFWHNSADDDFDWIVNQGNTPSVGTGPSNDVTGNGKYAYLEAGSDATCQDGKIAYLVSDCIKVGASADTCAMAFSYHQFGTDIGKLALQIAIEGQTFFTIWDATGNQDDIWHKQYIDLQQFRNKIVQFRFIGYGGTGIKADLALDQIEFYGSSIMGASGTTFYRDNDGDGYGNMAITVTICSSQPPAGYVTNDTDCDDRNAQIAPNKIEIPCNKIDENCNGNFDDTILSLPTIQSDTVCIGQNALLYAQKPASGKYYWYESNNIHTPIAFGDTLSVNNVTASKRYWVKDSALIKPGLRITELNLGVLDAVEIQNIGNAQNYTGWYVALGVSNSSGIYPVNAIWNLGTMAANEVQVRTRSTNNNFFGATFNWAAGAKGWAMIVDAQGKIVDFVIWETDINDLEQFSATINGRTFTRQDLPWSGIGLSTICFSGTTINLSTQTERNSADDYNPCGFNTIFNPNGTFNLDYICTSPNQEAWARVAIYPQLAIVNQAQVCEGNNIDIRNILVSDNNNTQGILTYHDSSPATVQNQLTNNTLTLTQNKNIVIKKTSLEGCSDEKTTTIVVNSNPVADISTTTAAVCNNQTKILNANYIGGSGIVNYFWSTGATNSSISAGASFPNVNGFYAVTITDNNGCRDSASIDISKGAGITAVRIVSVTNVTNCNTEDGKITLNPLDGTAPYNFQWNGAGTGAVGNVNGQYTIDNLRKGSYVITITDSSPLGCRVVIPFIAVNSPEVNIKIDTVLATSCAGINDGQIKLRNLGATANFAWSNGTTNKDATGLAPGKYSVTISNNICTQVLNNIEVKSPPPLSILSAIISNVSCTIDGKINITPQGGTPPYRYTWSNLSQNEDLFNIPVGKYTVTITDARNCSVVSPDYELRKVDLLQITAISSPAKCKNQFSGKIELNVTGGGQPYAYKWSNNAITRDIENIKAGTYTVSVTDANGCLVVSNQIAITEPNPLTISNLIQQPSCQGSTNGTISLTTNGGTAPYKYQWNVNKNTPNITQLASGNYIATVSDANGCSIQSIIFALNPPQAMTVSVTQIRNETCTGTKDGLIRLNLIGGTPPYQYQWNNTATTRDISNLPAGTYKLTITDANGCKINPDSIRLSGEQRLSIKKDSLVQPTCYAASDGKIYLQMQGGNAPYAYNWQHGNFNANSFNLKSGNYRVTVTDNVGCKTNKDFLLTQPQNIGIQINTLDSITCYGDENACIDIAVNGGTAPYIYYWNTGQNTQDLCGVPAGDYKLTILDKNNCIFSSKALIVPTVAPLQVVLKNNTGRCSGAAFGSLDIDVTGGSPPYRYEWSNGATTEDLNDVPSGNYSVIISDKNSCKASLSNIVIQNPLQRLRYERLTSKNITCNELDNGAIFAEIAGGQAPFAYNWSNGLEHFFTQRKDTITNLPKGIYTVTVTDNLGCVIKSDSIKIIEPTALNIFIKNIENPLCVGVPSGSINVNPSGGTLPYDFKWSNGLTSEDLTNISAGQYRLTLTDANQCKTTSPPLTLIEPQNAFAVAKDSVRAVSCKGKNDGRIYLKLTNGQAPYRFTWNTGVQNDKSVLSNLIAGFYSVTVTDTLGCIARVPNIAVAEPNAIGVIIDNVDNSVCQGQQQGAILISPTGGTFPYNFKWNNSAATQNIQNLADGKYRVTITDKNNCQYVSEEISINSGDSIRANVTTIPADIGQNNGAATVSVSGGKTPYAYLWNDAQQQTSRNATNLAKGDYQVTITDAKGCTKIVKSITIKTTALREPQLQGIVNIYPNPTEQIAFVEYELTTPLQNFEIQVVDLLGKVLLSQNNLDTQRGQISFDLGNFPKGVYIIRLIGNGKIGKTIKLVLI